VAGSAGGPKGRQAVTNASAVRNAAIFVEGLDSLPTLSTSAQAVLEAVQRPAFDFHLVSSLVEQDPSLAARLLKVANSAFYPSLQRVANLQLALSRLGAAEVGQLVLASAIIDVFNARHGGMDWQGFWNHSYACAIAAHLASEPAFRGAAAKNLGGNPYFVAGLVHNLGILVEYAGDPAGFESARQLAVKNGISLSEAERTVFGFTHAETGGILLEKWRLPGAVVDSALAHHDPDSYTGDHRKAVHAVHLSAMLCHGLGRSASFDPVLPGHSAQALLALGWTPERLPELQQRVAEAYERGTRLASAMLGSAE